MPLDATQIDRAARLLATAWKNRSAIEGLPDECMPATLEDGYRVQKRLVAFVGEPISGWKLGVTSKAAMERCNLAEPIIGRLWAATTVAEATPVRFDSFLSPTVEVELSLRLKHDLEGPCSESEAAQAVEAANLSIELADSRYTHPQNMEWPAVIADNTVTGAFVVGPAVERYAERPPGTICVLLNGKTIARANHADWPFSADRVLAFLAGSGRLTGDHPKAGQIVATGSLIVPVALEEKGLLQVFCDGLGTVSTELV